MMAAEGDGTLSGLLQRNRAWAEARTARDPSFFARLVGQQKPRFFWIGCADSRVPATEIVYLDPGEMFVHRNVANLAPTGDRNFETALGYAVDVLRVSHILLVGHYGCGGVEAALAADCGGPFRDWLAPLCETRERNADLLNDLDHQSRRHRLGELNVLAQVDSLARNRIVQAAWRRGDELIIHGLIYAVGDGLLGHICTATKHDVEGIKIEVMDGYGFDSHSFSIS